LLTPLIGAGNFTAEVQADVDLNETQATREKYDAPGVLRAETGSWTGNQKDAAVTGGIPGALSNTPPASSTMQSPQPANGVPGAPAAAPTAGAAAPDPMKQSDSFQRAYDLGKEVSVTRAAPGGVKRLSVAVLLRDPEKGRRTAMEINQVTELVKSAVGFDPARNDNVTVISRKFAGAETVADKAPWYDAGWLPIVARNVTAILIALLVLILGVRPLSKALLKKRDDVATDRPALGAPIEGDGAEPGITTQPVVSLDQLENSRGYDDRIGAVRGFTRDNPTRAALAVRDMIRADAK
ncbi:MAG: flagellar M-ring protein FliF, partial [Sphingomonas sp.]